MKLILINIAIIVSFCATALPAQTDYIEAEETTALSNMFPSSAGPGSIALALTETLASQSADADSGTLILVNADGVFVYDRATRELVVGVNTRSACCNGNTEATAISHVGPSVAYLATLQEANGEWRELAENLRITLVDWQAMNAAETDNWIDTISAPAWEGRIDRIQNMLDYAARMSITYLDGKLSGDGSDFTLDDVQENYFEAGPTEDFAIGYNNVMVGTFALVVLQDTYDIASKLREAEIDWTTTRVVVFMKIGNNYGAGLTAATNWNSQLFLRLSGNESFGDQVYYAPYLDRRDGIGADPLEQDTFDYYDQAFVGLQNRVRSAGKAFASIADIDVPVLPGIPGDWGVSDFDAVEDFVKRLKNTFGGGTQLLSNATGFWIPGALQAAGWDPTKVELPGFDFPKNVDFDWTKMTPIVE